MEIQSLLQCSAKMNVNAFNFEWKPETRSEETFNDGNPA